MFEGTLLGVDTKTEVVEFNFTCRRTDGRSTNVYDLFKVDLKGARLLTGSPTGRLRRLNFQSWSSFALANHWTGAILLARHQVILTTTESVCHGTLG